jgi:2,3,4,5-tetrahydropyridine-2,6-dicarboxylate N-succinyltransferase
LNESGKIMQLEEYIDSTLKIAPETMRGKAFERLQPIWEGLESGELRSAHKTGSTWEVDRRIKSIIIWAFKAGSLVDMEAGGAKSALHFTDKDTLPVQKFSAQSERRVVPGGSSVRGGSYVAPGVIIMPPAYINIGAYVDEGTLIDSHALVGSCAQIGKNVHVSAAVQIGGVLEPIGAVPVVVEDNVMIGGNCGVYEGTIVKQGAVLGTGVILNASTPVYDLVTGEVHKRTKNQPLTIPENAVVIPGSRPAKGEIAAELGVHLYTPVIVKYRDDKTDLSTTLEDALR